MNAFVFICTVGTGYSHFSRHRYRLLFEMGFRVCMFKRRYLLSPPLAGREYAVPELTMRRTDSKPRRLRTSHGISSLFNTVSVTEKIHIYCLSEIFPFN